MKQKRLQTITGGLVALGLSTVLIVLGLLDGVGKPASGVIPLAPAAQIAPAAAEAIQLIGAYSGQVQLQAVTTGVYSATLAPPTPTPSSKPVDLGRVDLALQLNQTGNRVSGYVDLSKTLIFTVEHTLPGPPALAVGPYVTGVFDGVNFRLTAEAVKTVVTGRTITRQFSLVGAIAPGNNAPGDSATLVGEYRETLWGYASEPLTIIGAFTLKRPSFGAEQGNVNKAPITTADRAVAVSGSAVTIDVLANDTDDDGDPLTITSVSTPQQGHATTDGVRVLYTPAPGFQRVDSFSYFVSDGKGGVTAGLVTVTIGDGVATGNALYLPLIRR